MNVVVAECCCQVIHCYGHGGSGVTLHWGCAGDTVKLIQRSLGMVPLQSNIWTMSAVFYLSRLPLIGKDDAQGQIAKVPDVMKKVPRETQTLHAGCSKAEQKNFAPPQTPFLGAQDGQNLISWRWSLPLPTNPVWWGLMHAISSYCGNRPTNTHAHKPTDRTDYNTLRCS